MLKLPRTLATGAPRAATRTEKAEIGNEAMLNDLSTLLEDEVAAADRAVSFAFLCGSSSHPPPPQKLKGKGNGAGCGARVRERAPRRIGSRWQEIGAYASVPSHHARGACVSPSRGFAARKRFAQRLECQH
ncbi:MAG: hypothetical protein Q8P73_01015 [bacterium]|nr:hypothetical protein [bacterium]